MQTKLTLRLDAELIERAKRHARARHKSLSRMVADYFAALEKEDLPTELPPLTRSLRGLLKEKGLDESAYHRHLEEKYL